MCPVDSLRTETKFKKTEIGEIPVDWEIFRLGEIAHITMGQSPPSSSCFDYKNGLPFFQGKAEFGIKYPRILKWCHAPKIIADKEDILISVRAPVGDINVAPEKSCIGRGLAAIRAVKSYNEYLYYSLNYFKKKLAKIGQGSAFEAINKNDLFELAIPFPPLNEQISIAHILKSIDEAIDKKRAIIEKTKELKKGLMQKLLTCGIGHTKFKITDIGEIPKEWKLAKLGNVAMVRYGIGQPPEIVANGIPMIRATNIKKGHIIPHELIYVNKNTMPNSRISYLKEGDILIVRSGVNTGDIGLITKRWEGAIAGYDLIVTPYIKLDSLFLSYYLLSPNIQNKYFVSLKDRSAQPHLNAKQIEMMPVALPSLLEQERIASVLGGLDREIQCAIAHEDNLANNKVGLMETLLTGKLRVRF